MGCGLNYQHDRGTSLFPPDRIFAFGGRLDRSIICVQIVCSRAPLMTVRDGRPGTPNSGSGASPQPSPSCPSRRHIGGSACVIHSLCCPVCGRPASPRKSHSKSQRGQTSGHSQLRQATVEAGQVPSEPSPATSNDVWEVTGGQGVAGSNPAVPTGREVFSNILMPHESQQKSHLHVNWPLLKARADRVPSRPTRASAKTAEPAKLPIKRSKIAQPPHTCTATPAGMRSRRLSAQASCTRQGIRPTV